MFGGMNSGPSGASERDPRVLACLTIASLVAGEAKLRLPWAVTVGDVPVTLGDGFWVEGSSGDDLAGDRQRGHAYAVRFQVGPEHRRGRPERRLAQRDRCQGGDRMIGESTAGEDDDAVASGPH